MKLIGKFNLRSIEPKLHRLQFRGYGGMVDTQVLGSCGKNYCKGSSPFIPKLQKLKNPNSCSAYIYNQIQNVSYIEVILKEKKKKCFFIF